MKKRRFISGQASSPSTPTAGGTGWIRTAGRLGLAAGLALCMLGLSGGSPVLAASSPQEGATRPDEQWGTTQAPSATPNGGQLSIERDEKTGDIEMNITAPRQNTDPNAWQQAPMYLAPQVYPNTGSAGGGQAGYPGYQPGYPGYQPGYPGYQPGYPPNRPGFRPPYQPGYPGFPDRYPSGQTGWPGAPSRPWPPTSGQYPGQRPGYPGYPGYPGQTPVNPSTPSSPSIPSIPLMPSYPSNPGQNTGYPNPNPGGLYPPPTDGWHWYPGYQGDPGPYPPGVMPLNEGMRSAPRYGGMMPRNGAVPQGRMPYRRR